MPFMNRRRVLLVGPVPPMIGGDTVMTLNLLRSRHWSEHSIDVDHVDISTGGSVRQARRRLTLGDLPFALKILARVCVRLPRVDTVLLWVNSRFVYTGGLSIILFAVLARKRIVLKVFGTDLPTRLRGLRQPWKTVTAALLGRVTYLLPETGQLAEEFDRELGISAGSVRCMPNFIPDREILSFPERKTFSGRCLYLGHVKREKGVFEIVDALRGRDEFSCDFYGEFVERDREHFHEVIGDRGNLSYRGVIEPQEVAETLRRYDLLLLPTYHTGEGYPAVILQAFAAGVPVVTTRWKSIPEIVEDGVTGLLIPVRSPGRLCEAIGRLAADTDLYHRIVSNALAHVRSFSETAVVRDILIRDILGQRPPNRGSSPP